MLASIGLFGLLSSSQAVPIAPERSAAHGYQLPLTFEVNQGQTDDRVDFLARGPNYNIFLTATEAVFALPKASAKSGQRPVMRMQIIGSAADPAVQGVDALPGKINYFHGKDSASWRTKVPTYQRVKYSAVYPGVDLVYYGQSQQLEYDFIVAPGADPNTIKLGFAGVEQTTVDARGDLVLKTGGGPLRFKKPIVYQLEGRHRHTIEGGYVHRSPHQIGFRVGAYDRTRPLIIDPVLSYSTYLGGSGDEGSTGIAVDATGAVYVSGTTSSTDFPTVNAMQPARNGFGSDSDLFVAKLTPDGTALVYATYLGGSNNEGAPDIAVDSAGAAYISAITFSEDFPTMNAFQPANKGSTDAVVAKLSADGSRLIYSTYLGGNGYEAEQGVVIAVDLAGAAYIAGSTASVDFPVVNALQPTLPENRLAAFVTKLAPDGSALLYSTYLGGTQQGAGARDIAVDSLGAAYVTGWTNSADFPLVNPLPGTGGGIDTFVSKLAPDGMSLIYSTFLGGSGSDWGLGIAIDASGAAYVTGNTDSGDFPTMNAVKPQSDGGVDAFVVKIAPEGGAMIYGTYLGGQGHDSGYGIAVDTAGAAHVTGRTESADFPTMNAIQPALRGRVDAFVSLLSPNGEALVYSTYLGGSAEEGARYRFLGFPTSMAITVDLTGATYVTSWTRSKDFPTTTSLFARCRGGDSDAFVVKITDDSLASPEAGASFAGPPTSESSSTSSERKSGGGAIDALFLAVLAQLAVAGAVRRRSRRGQ